MTSAVDPVIRHAPSHSLIVPYTDDDYDDDDDDDNDNDDYDDEEEEEEVLLLDCVLLLTTLALRATAYVTKFVILSSVSTCFISKTTE
jgi:hypothetical protein